MFLPELITSDAASAFARRFAQEGIKVHSVPMGLTDLCSSAKKLSKVIDFSEVAVIQSHMFRESFIGRLLKRAHPEILHAFRAQTYIDCSWIPGWKKRLYHLADKLTQRYVDVYYANGEYLRDELIHRSGIPGDKIHVVLNGSAGSGLPPRSFFESAGTLRPEVAMVANLTKHKGHDVLIRSLGLLKSRGLSVKAKLLGSFDPGDGLFLSLKALAEANGVLSQLEFAGFSENADDETAAIAVVVLPSDREGVPNCILEAMSAGKIAVAASTGGVPEIITDGYNGFLHEARNHTQLADILQRIFSVPASSLKPVGAAAYGTWREKFTMDHMMNGFIRVYGSLMARKLPLNATSKT